MPDVSAVRETLEETGIVVVSPRLVAFNENTVNSPKPEGWRYPYPTGYMLFYLCELVEEKPFEGSEDTHGRVWVSPEEFKNVPWCVKNKILLDEVVHIYKQSQS